MDSTSHGRQMASKHGGFRHWWCVAGSEMEGRGGRDRLWNSSAHRVPPNPGNKPLCWAAVEAPRSLSLTQQQPAATP